MKIVTENIRPPVPSRRFDWVAYFADMEDDSPVGFGPTENAAIVDLMDKQHSREEVKNV
jgi:hypothetical protein